MAHSGGMLLLFGGYTAAGATRRCYAWGCQPPDANEPSSPGAAGAVGVGAGPTALPGAASAVGSMRAAPNDPLVLLACPAEAPAQRHAAVAQPAMAEALPGAQVVCTPPADWSAEAHVIVPSADSPEQALSLLTQTLQRLTLQRSAFVLPRSTTLLSRAHLLAAVQPCRHTLRISGEPRVFECFWVGVTDVQRGKTAVGSSAAREVTAERAASGGGRAAHGGIDGDVAALLDHAWRTLLRGF